MQKVLLTQALDLFQMLADNPYSVAWELIEDFTVNGHVVSVKRSRQYRQVIIDNTYVAIGGDTTIYVPEEGGQYTRMTPIEYAEHILIQPSTTSR